MSSRLPLFTRNLPEAQESNDPNSPAEQRDDAKRNFLKTMRPLPTQHYWNVYFDRQAKEGETGDQYHSGLEQLGTQIESVQDFWRYANNTPVGNIGVRESLYLFKSGFRPVWEDRRNILGGSWTFRFPKSMGPDVWTRVQLLAIGEKLQSVLDEGMSLLQLSEPSLQALTIVFCRGPALWCWTFSPLQLPPHHRLASRRLQEELSREHCQVHHGRPPPGDAPQARRLLLQAPL